MTRRYAFNSVGFPYEGIERNCECLAEAGYDGVEMRVGTDMLEDPELAERVAEAATKYDLETPSIAASAVGGTPMATDDADRRERAIEDARTTIEEVGVDILGVETVLLVPGSYGPDRRYDLARETALESVRAVAAIAEDCGVALALENIQNDFLTSPVEFREFIDRAAESAPVGAYLDLGNARRYGYPEHWVRILDDRIEKLHVKGHRKDGERTTYLLQGDVDWPTVAAAVEEVGYEGWVTPEFDAYRSLGERMPAQVLANLRAVFGEP